MSEDKRDPPGWLFILSYIAFLMLWVVVYSIYRNTIIAAIREAVGL